MSGYEEIVADGMVRLRMVKRCLYLLSMVW